MSVVDPHIQVAGVPDWRTVDELLDSIVHDGMSAEERVLTVFHTVRRMFVHGPTPRELAYDFHRVMHVLGTGACLSMTTPLNLLYERLGYRSQSWVHDDHHMLQVEYGGAWHCLDPHMCFGCYDRSQPPQLASVEQLRADPTLARDAVAEGRAIDGYLLCGDRPDWFAGNEGDWYLEAGGDWPQVRLQEPFGAITLRPGESYTRSWQPGPHFYNDGWLERDGCGPIHHCAEADRQDAANWPLYEPHGWTRPTNGRTYYRAWGVGVLQYQPRFVDDSYRAGVTDEGNTTVTDGVLCAADESIPATITFAVGCPYVLTAANLQLTLTGGGHVSAWVHVHDKEPIAARPPGRGPSQMAHDWTEIGLAHEGDGNWAVDFDEEINGCLDGYELRLQITDGGGVEALRLTSHFQLNRFSLPNLLPGHNTVDVSAHRFDAPLVVCYKWAEGPGWEQPRCERRTLRQDERFELEVAGPHYPRMQELSLAVE
ncbi:MAG TPA: hypothetical protein EYQ31_01825 [Candidatus Handelsmanbacteria bacterium]|nr:hypothetical protein [Candidatus Handelsmanbacteria bacterium]